MYLGWRTNAIRIITEPQDWGLGTVYLHLSPGLSCASVSPFVKWGQLQFLHHWVVAGFKCVSVSETEDKL